MALNVKQNRTRPRVYATLKQDGVAIDLTTADTVEFVMRLATAADDSAPLIQAEAEVITPASGIVRYEWQAGDTDTRGTYNAEWLITWNDGSTETVPNSGYSTITIGENLDA